MKEGPDIAHLGSLIGDPARANILSALMSGKALTATELANEAGVTPQTASSHLQKLEQALLIKKRKQGRHRYFTLADADVGDLLETMMGLAARRGMLRTRTGPKDEDLRNARVCYNHLAGNRGVQLYDSLVAQKALKELDQEILLTKKGEAFVEAFGIHLSDLSGGRRPLCKSCLDWSSRRTHLAGALGTALLERMFTLGWAARQEGTRVVTFTRSGEKKFDQHFAI